MKELKSYAEALLAWADGKPIQYKNWINEPRSVWVEE